MRRLLIALLCLTVWSVGCESQPTDSGQDPTKAKKRPMVKPGDVPNHVPTPPKG